MDKVSERFILEYEVRDSIFFLPTIPWVVCVKYGRVFHSLSKDYSLFCLLFSVMLCACLFAVYTNGMLIAFVNEHRSPVKRYSLLFAFVNEHRSLVKRYSFKDVRAHCYCASLVRTLFIGHARATSFSSARTESKT